MPEKSSHWLLINDCCLSSSQRLAGVGHKAKPLLQGLARGRRIQRKPCRLLCGYFSLSWGATGQEDEQGNDAYSLHDVFGAATFRLSGSGRDTFSFFEMLFWFYILLLFFDLFYSRAAQHPLQRTAAEGTCLSFKKHTMMTKVPLP